MDKGRSAGPHRRGIQHSKNLKVEEASKDGRTIGTEQIEQAFERSSKSVSGFSKRFYTYRNGSLVYIRRTIADYDNSGRNTCDDRAR